MSRGKNEKIDFIYIASNERSGSTLLEMLLARVHRGSQFYSSYCRTGNSDYGYAAS